ncbi:MAG: RNA polymerase sigma factor [Archangium sp.]|nr:RNA polymerase sigma factor [Archangium sp.]
MSDLDALASRAVAGDAAALSTLCRELEAPVFRLCLRMLGDVRDAEDAAQDVLVKVITNLSRFEGRSALTTWVHQVAVRHVLALKKSRAEVRALDDDAFVELLEQGLAFSATQPPPTPEDRALINEVRLSCTQGMLLSLSRDERLSLVLVDLLGFDGAEAADIVETSHDAFRQRVSRARAKLSAFLQRACGEANEQAACRCEKQLAAKQSMGMKLRFTPLSMGDAPASVVTAHAELKAMRSIASAFHRDGLFGAPASLRARMQQALPTVLKE